MTRGSRTALPIALAALVLVALLDLLTPPDVNFADFYLLPVVITSWALGWRTGTVFAALVVIAETLVDSGFLRTIDASPSALIVTWNAFSGFIAFTVVAFVTDRVYQERERWQSVNNERARLLRLLEREFPRPLRAVDWFMRTFEDGLARESGLPAKLREQFEGLRHHTREVNFLATDLIRIGRIRSGELAFTPEVVDLTRIATDAADHTVDRNRVLVTTSDDTLLVWADPEPLRHAISSVIGRLLENSPHELVQLFVRGSGDEAVVEFTTRGKVALADDFELADLLTTANGGRLVVVPRIAELGVRLNLYIPRADAGTPTPNAASTVSTSS